MKTFRATLRETKYLQVDVEAENAKQAKDIIEANHLAGDYDEDLAASDDLFWETSDIEEVVAQPEN